MSENPNQDKPAAPAAELVSITIDGKPYRAPKGENLLQFMLDQGIEISYFCYHPGLSVVAVCRQCLVELKNVPKLVPACQTRISDGMDVTNSSARVLAARRQMLEFTLLNHPVDCPICDKAGECILQKHYMEWDHQPARIDHPKVHKPKAVDIGPRIVLDDERCILCGRCARFCAEVVGNPQLVIGERGNHSVLTTAPGTLLDNPYSLNTVDICPVGALTDKDFRFKIRVWQLSATQSVCNGCATGCLTEVQHHRNRVYRLVPRRTRDINLNWMCDYGRYTYKAIAADRLSLPVVDGQETGWDDALGRAGERLTSIAARDTRQIGIVLGADATNEDNFMASRLALEFLAGCRLYVAAEPAGTMGDALLRDNDPNPNRAGALACGRGRAEDVSVLEQDLAAGSLKALWVMGDRLHLSDAALASAQALPFFAVQATHPGRITRAANVVLPAAMWAEVDGTITSRTQKTERLRAAVSLPDFARPHWQILVQLSRHAGMTLDYKSAKDVFTAMQHELEFFAQARWGKDLPPMLLRFAGARG